MQPISTAAGAGAGAGAAARTDFHRSVDVQFDELFNLKGLDVEFVQIVERHRILRDCLGFDHFISFQFYKDLPG